MHPTRNYFAEFKGNNRVFVETGTYRGDAVQLAHEAGYEQIYTIDIDPEATTFIYNRFNMPANEVFAKKIHPVAGDSAVMLREVLKFITEPCTFWLDSHWQQMDTEPRGANPFPLLKELAQIKEHGIKEHTILIDDFLMMTHPNVTQWTRKMIEDGVHRINRDYKIEYLPNPIINNLMAAYV